MFPFKKNSGDKSSEHGITAALRIRDVVNVSPSGESSLKTRARDGPSCFITSCSRELHLHPHPGEH